MKHWRSALYVFIGASCYGILSTMVKLAYEDGFDAGEVTGSQMLFGLLFLLSITIMMKKWEKLELKQWLLLAASGILVGLTGIFYYSSLKFIPASIAVVLLFQFTWIGVLLEALFEKAMPSSSKMVSLLLLLAGTILAGKVWGTDAADLPLIGILLGLTAAVSYAGFISASGRLAVHVNPWMRSTIMSLGSLLIVITVFPPVFLVNGALVSGLWWWGSLLAFFGIFLPNILFTFGVPEVGTGLAAILGSAELPMAVFMSWIVLGERVTGGQWVGVMVILLGIMVTEVPFKKMLRHNNN